MPITTDYPSAGIAVVTIRRPEKLNALDPAHIAELTNAFRELSGDDLRAVILTGEGKAFVGGADIKHMAGLTPETARAFITSLHNLFTAIRECPVPVIGAVNGYCLGAGMELAAACDFRIGSDTAVYGMPEVKVGVPSVVEAALLPGLIGAGRTSWLVLTGENIYAAQADEWCFIEHTVEAGALSDSAMKSAEGIAAAGPNAVRAQKRLLRLWEDAPLDESVAKSIVMFGEAFETNEPATLMASFTK